MTTKTNTKIHEIAVEEAACRLIENGIPTKSGNVRGIDLVLDNGKTVLVRGQSEEVSVPLMNRDLVLKADYIAIVTNTRYTIRKIFIMSTEMAKKLADNRPYKYDGRDNWFIEPSVYRSHRNDYGVLTE